MRKRSSSKILQKKFLLTALSIVLVVMTTSWFTSGVRSSDQRRRLTPSFSPAYLSLLKQQADARKGFFAEQAKAKTDLKNAQKQERNDTLSRHREERRKFLAEKHGPSDRKTFFNGQRNEFTELKKRQNDVRKDLDKTHAEKLDEFEKAQRAARMSQVEAEKSPQTPSPTPTSTQ